MKLSGRAKAGIATAAIIVVGVIFVVRVLTSRTNENALVSSLSIMSAEDRDRAQRLLKMETAGMTQNEDSGVVYYDSSAGTRDRQHRIYLLWSMSGLRSRTYRIVASALGNENPAATRTIGIVIYVNLGFYIFRGKYEMMLSRAFRDMGFGGLRGACYRWDDKLGSWAFVTDLSNDTVVALLTANQKRAILDGTYNMVSATELKEAR